MFRYIACCTLLAMTSPWLLAANTVGMLETRGTVLRNGSAAARFEALFPGDVIETKVGSVAHLASTGLDVQILPETIIELGEKGIVLEHGRISVSTSLGTTVKSECLSIVPILTTPTLFDVVDVNGAVQVAARKSDIRIDKFLAGGPLKRAGSSKGSTVLHEGDQAKRSESDGCNAEERTHPAGSGGILGSDYLKYGAIAGAVGAGIGVILLPDQPASPFKP